MPREGNKMSNTAFPRCNVEANNPVGSPGREKGSRTINVKSRTPTSVQDIGKSTFGPLSRGNSGSINTGRVDPGKGKGF
jgi:hypothetical protein